MTDRATAATATIDPDAFVAALAAAGVPLVTGVPDSLLHSFCAAAEDLLPPDRHIVAANEGQAVALAAGAYLATGRPGLVYLQNSGLGNAVNPLLSLCDQAVYGLPVVLLVGWRGEPGVPDEPQHSAQGRLTFPLLDTLGVPAALLEADGWERQVEATLARAAATGQSQALVVRKGLFSRHAGAATPSDRTLTREDALAAILAAVGPDALLVTTTGKTSRELFELRESRGEGHGQDFLTVGSMGHAVSIALGVALGTDRLVYCVDGDGACLMHLGAVAVAAQQARDNLRYIVVNNGAHESVGGLPTVGFDVDLAAILRGAGFNPVSRPSAVDLTAALSELRGQPRGALVIEVRQGSRADLGRPTTTPRENKAAFMNTLARGTP